MFPLLWILAEEESLSYNTAQTHNTSCHPRGLGKSHGSACVLTSVLLGHAPALLEVQQLCETWGLMDSLFLLCMVKGGGTKIPLYARACSSVQSSDSVLHPLLPLCRAGMKSPVCRVQLCVPVGMCVHIGEHGRWVSHPLAEVAPFWAEV